MATNTGVKKMKTDTRVLELRILQDYERALEEIAKGHQDPKNKWIGLGTFGEGAHECSVQYNPLGRVYKEKYLVSSNIEGVKRFNNVTAAYMYAMKHSKFSTDYQPKDL